MLTGAAFLLFMLAAGGVDVDLDSFLRPAPGRTYMYRFTVARSDEPADIVAIAEGSSRSGEVRVMEMPIVPGVELPTDFITRVPGYRLVVNGDELLRIDDDGARSILMRKPVAPSSESWTRTLKIGGPEGKRVDAVGSCRVMTVETSAVPGIGDTTVVTTRCEFAGKGGETIRLTERYGVNVGTVTRRLEFYNREELIDWNEVSLVEMR